MINKEPNKNMSNIGNNRSVLITGCSSGIGLDSALLLQAHGFDVYATARQGIDVDKLKAKGLKAHLLDVTDETSITLALNWLLAQTDGKLFALFNNAAYGQPGAIEDLPIKALKAQFETNIFGWHVLTQKVIPIMRKQGYGRIIQNSSVLGLVAMRYRGAYNASKFAIEGYTDTLRLELEGSGIQVVLIEPGPITSQFRANALTKFTQEIDLQKSIHVKSYKQQIDRLSVEESSTPFTLSAEAVSKKVLKALTVKKAKPRYFVTKATYIMAWCKRLLPTSLLDKILIKG